MVKAGEQIFVVFETETSKIDMASTLEGLGLKFNLFSNLYRAVVVVPEDKIDYWIKELGKLPRVIKVYKDPKIKITKP